MNQERLLVWLLLWENGLSGEQEEGESGGREKKEEGFVLLTSTVEHDAETKVDTLWVLVKESDPVGSGHCQQTGLRFEFEKRIGEIWGKKIIWGRSYWNKYIFFHSWHKKKKKKTGEVFNFIDGLHFLRYWVFFLIILLYSRRLIFQGKLCMNKIDDEWSGAQILLYNMLQRLETCKFAHTAT